MTGPEFRALREASGLSLHGMAVFLGLADGAYSAAVSRVRTLEKRGIRPGIRDDGLRRRVAMLESRDTPINVAPD